MTSKGFMRKTTLKTNLLKVKENDFELGEQTMDQLLLDTHNSEEKNFPVRKFQKMERKDNTRSCRQVFVSRKLSVQEQVKYVDKITEKYKQQ